MLLACFQQAQYFTPAIRERFSRLAGMATSVAALGTGMPDTPAPGVRGTSLGESDPLLGEWDIVVGPHFAGTLVVVTSATQDRTPTGALPTSSPTTGALVIEAAAGLLTKITPLPIGPVV